MEGILRFVAFAAVSVPFFKNSKFLSGDVMERFKLYLPEIVKKTLSNPLFLRSTLSLMILTTATLANRDSLEFQKVSVPEMMTSDPFLLDFRLLIQEYKTTRPLIPNLSSTKKRFTAEDTLKALEGASPLVKCAVGVEVGPGTKEFAPYDPNAIGKEGELGAGQLHPQGKLPAFYAAGNDDPFNPYQVVPFVGEQFALGDANHWAGIRDKLC